MRLNHQLSHLLRLLLILSTINCVTAQTPPDANYQTKRQKAVELFDRGKRLEALPLLEELVHADPKDDEMLVDLAASLVDHAATLTDDEAAGRERLRARDLLDRAWKLGNTSPLAMNLAQLLQQLPANGSIAFSDNPEVQRFMEAGEAAFSRRDFDIAVRNYTNALELEPGNSAAALFIGNSYDKQNEFTKAAEWYQRAIKLDPNVETPYRYYADMLAREGDMREARAMLIQAAVAEPYNRIVWRELHAWAALNDTQINLVYVGIPAERTGEARISPGSEKQALSTAWDAYHDVRKNWQQGGEFNKHFPNEKEYRHSLAEETQALIAAAAVLAKLDEDKKTSEFVAKDQGAALLLKLYRAASIDPYVLFSLGDAGIARDYAAYRAGNRAKLEEYMDRFVVPPADSRP